jgi:hypothetical protein
MNIEHALPAFTIGDAETSVPRAIFVCGCEYFRRHLANHSQEIGYTGAHCRRQQLKELQNID